jgi:hypothetical protein
MSWLLLFPECARSSDPCRTRRDPDGRGTGPGADHRAEIRTAPVLRPVGVVDCVIDRFVDRFESHVLRHAGDCDPARLLARRGLIPTGVPPVVGTDVEICRPPQPTRSMSACRTSRCPRGTVRHAGRRPRRSGEVRPSTTSLQILSCQRSSASSMVTVIGSRAAKSLAVALSARVAVMTLRGLSGRSPRGRHSQPCRSQRGC